MSALWIAALALMAPPASGADNGIDSSRAEKPAAIAAQALTAEPTPAQLRSEMSSRLRTAAEVARSDDAAAARRLLTLHDEIVADDRLPLDDRTRYLRIVRYRLTGLQKSIARSITDSDGRSKASRGAASFVSAKGGRGGAAVRDSGQELVDLIQTTIAPDSWDVNGGPGSIVYYQPLRVIVVRQTDRVHELLGGAVGGPRGR